MGLYGGFFTDFNIFIQRRPANPNQPGEVRCRYISIFPHWVILLKVDRNLPWRAANRATGFGTISLGFGHAFKDPLHGQLALHLGHGAQDSQHELKMPLISQAAGPGIQTVIKPYSTKYSAFLLCNNETKPLLLTSKDGIVTLEHITT